MNNNLDDLETVEMDLSELLRLIRNEDGLKIWWVSAVDMLFIYDKDLDEKLFYLKPSESDSLMFWQLFDYVVIRSDTPFAGYLDIWRSGDEELCGLNYREHLGDIKQYALTDSSFDFELAYQLTDKQIEVNDLPRSTHLSRPSIVYDVQAVLREKGLDECYISDKMELFLGVQDNLRALAKSRFLDSEGRFMLAERLKVSVRELDNFYEISQRYS
ncbi:hypothetical protein [Lelliottia steviae]|uniref:hypothetical protein n=1 Tax=Pseudoalteromonas sp. TaxID=53249 RepID=UPI00187FAD59|nr:hypothetical protein [Lelliottia steviae]